MNYHIGAASNQKEINDAMLLATEIFRGSSNNGFQEKKNILTQTGSYEIKPKDVIICKNNGQVIGACFIVFREIYNHRKIVRGAFLASICVAKNYQGRGISKKILDHAFEVLRSNKCEIAVVIARKTVDFYYNKFDFLGISTYTKLKILKLNQKCYVDLDEYELIKSDETNIEAISEIYHNIYKEFMGPCVRSYSYWKHLYERIKKEPSTKLLAVKNNSNLLGYVIISDETVYEIAMIQNRSYIPIIKQLQIVNGLNLVYHIPSYHPLLRELVYSDFEITKRQCFYGGHLIKLIGSNLKSSEIQEKVNEVLNFLYNRRDNISKLNDFNFDILFYDQI